MKNSLYHLFRLKRFTVFVFIMLVMMAGGIFFPQTLAATPTPPVLLTVTVPSLTYSGSVFTEASANNGTIDNTSPLTITLSGSTTFTGLDGSDFVADAKVSVTNLPGGLTAVVTKNSNTELSVTITGTATSHAAMNSVSDLTFIFQNTAFANNDASGVIGFSKNDLQVSFINPVNIPHALSFDGIDDCVIAASVAPYQTDNFTYEAWIKRNANSNDQVIVTTGYVFGAGVTLFISGNKLYGINNGHETYGYSTTLSPGVWHHVAVVRNTAWTLYVDGIGETFGSLAPDNNLFGFKTAIGNFENGGDAKYDGLIDEVRISNIARYSGNFTPPTGEFTNDANTVLLYHFNEASGSTTQDYSSNNNTGTLQNGTARTTQVYGSLSYSTSSFSEVTANNGTINNSSPMIITLNGFETFTGANSDDFVAAGKIAVTNLPAGLTAVISRTSSTTLSVTLTGYASDHAEVNNVSNLTFTFANSAFTNIAAASVVNYAKNDLQVSFQNPYSAHSISFDGVDDYVNIPIAASPTAYSVEMWVKPASTSNAVIFERTNTGGPTTAFSHELDIVNGKFQHYVYDGGSWTVIGTTTVTANTWYHVAITASNGGMMRLYVNGVEEGTPVSIGTLWPDGNRYVLNGYRPAPGFIQYSGLIDELRIWNSQRSQAQISASMNSQLSGNESGLLAYWNCDEGTGTTMYDQTNNIYNAALENGASWSLPSGNLVYSGSTFSEAVSNNGAIDNSSPKTITLYGPITFSGSNSDDFVAGGKITVSGIPSGLTAVATRTSSNTLSVTLTGTTSNHSAVNSVSNLGLTFKSGAFIPSIDSATVGGYNKSDLSVSFVDPSPTLLGGNTLVLDGTGDYVLSSTTLGNFGSSDFTIEAWIKTTVPSRVILGKRFSGSDGSFFVLAMDGSGKPGLELDEDDTGTNYSATSATTSVSDGNWHHIACTRSGTTISYYRDGVLDGQTTADVASISNGTAFSIGTRYGDGFGYVSFFNGSIDDVRLWNVARSQAQIAANKDSYISSTTSGLIGNFRFDESSGSSTAEIINQSANAGTLYGDAHFSNSPLPVELVSFNADNKRNAIELQWKTATEQNNHGFEVQRSAVVTQGSTPRWDDVAFVSGNGTSNSPHEYSFTDQGLKSGKYQYRLKQVDNDGQFGYSMTVEVTVGSAPLKFELSQNYPNPFNPSTTIGFTLQVSSQTTLTIYDAIGRVVAELANEYLEAGTYHQRTFDASRFSSGIYFARLSSEKRTEIKKLLLMK